MYCRPSFVSPNNTIPIYSSKNMPRKSKQVVTDNNAAAGSSAEIEEAKMASAAPELSEKDQYFENLTQEDCTVCYEKKGEDAGVLACKHSFCFNCIQSWSKQETTCPLCKAKFTAIDRVKKAKSGRNKFSKRKVAVRNRSQADAHRNFANIAPGLFLHILQHLNMNIMNNWGDDEDDEDYVPDEEIYHFVPHRNGHRRAGTREDPIVIDVDGARRTGVVEVIDLTADDAAAPSDGVSSSSSSSSSGSAMRPIEMERVFSSVYQPPSSSSAAQEERSAQNASDSFDSSDENFVSSSSSRKRRRTD